MRLSLEDERIVDEYVRFLYRHKCARCQARTDIVHEIVPKSKRPADWWQLDNLILLCQSCHEWSHELGTAKREEELRGYRRRAAKVTMGDFRLGG